MTITQTSTSSGDAGVADALLKAVDSMFGDFGRQTWGDDVVDDVQDASRFVVRNKVAILAVPTTVVTVGGFLGLDLTHAVPASVAGVLAAVVAVASMFGGATYVAGKHATTSDPRKLPMDVYGRPLLNAAEAVAAARSVIADTIAAAPTTAAPLVHAATATPGDIVDPATLTWNFPTAAPAAPAVQTSPPTAAGEASTPIGDAAQAAAQAPPPA